MNRNIHMISQCLWSVNFDYVKNNMIQEMRFKDPAETNNLVITSEGRFLLNEGLDGYEKLIPMILVIMQLEKREISTKQGFCKVLRCLLPKVRPFDDQTIMKELMAKNYESWSLWTLYENISKLEAGRRSEVFKGYC